MVFCLVYHHPNKSLYSGSMMHELTSLWYYYHYFLIAEGVMQNVSLLNSTQARLQANYQVLNVIQTQDSDNLPAVRIGIFYISC